MPKNNLSNLKVALCYDRVNKFGGAERVIESIHQLFPSAPLYTLVYDPKGAPWAKSYDVRTTFLNKIPFFRSRHELLAFLASFAFETFSFDQYDLVISITSESAKDIITKPETLHACYCLTPTRYLWSGKKQYHSQPGMGIISPLVKKILHVSTKYLQRQDLVISQRPDEYLAISKEVQKRITKYYHRNSEIIYPPVNYSFFSKTDKLSCDHYLLVGRLVPYKKADIVIKAFSRPEMSDRKLIVVGEGSQKHALRKLATNNVTFTSLVNDQELRQLYSSAKAVVFPPHEDFGITPLEAQACGTPVLAYRGGGALETVIDGKTGLFFDEQTPGAIIEVINRFENNSSILSDACRQNAKKFSNTRFQKLLFAKLESQWQKHQDQQKQ